MVKRIIILSLMAAVLALSFDDGNTGPVVLAGELGPVNDSHAHDLLYVPVVMTTQRDPVAWTVPVPGLVNTFRFESTGRPRDVQLRPFYETYDVRYSIFWDLFTEETWTNRCSAFVPSGQIISDDPENK